ncbi:MAG TPA: hypothetical protein VKZ18_20125 [Polyangia bacterium]|nr:hypothetical protein [Polyangia bacterium]
MIVLPSATLLALLFAQAIAPADARPREPAEAARARPLPLPMPPAEAEPRLPPGGEPPPRRPRPRRALDPEILRALAAQDPPVAALRAAATALVLAEPERAHSLVARARFAGWLPELRLLVDRRFARTESVDLGTPTDSTALAPVGIDSNNDVRYQARATWDLSRIVYNPDELAAQSQALRTADTRREIESLVIRLYFERRRLKAESVAADDLDMLPGTRRELRIAEIEAELDALTGGAFTRLARHQPIEGESRSEP